MPAHLSGLAAVEWKRVVRMLAERSTMTRADAPILELYVETYSSWRKCVEEVTRDGPIAEVVVLDSRGEPHTVRKQSEASKLAAKLAAQMRQLLKEFGGTPASREKATPTKEGFREKEPARPGTLGYQLQKFDEEKKKNAIRTGPATRGNTEPALPAPDGAGSVGL
jgi:P27 family predicted phage terminase small subunit